eukprot:scaffold7213_cov166-Amphora_coffeaeformis.AAC.2
MKISQVVFSAFALAATTEAYSTQTSSRRAFVQSAAAAVVVGTTATAANAMDACPKGSNNCIRTTWTPPSGAAKSEIAATVKTILSNYPQVREKKKQSFPSLVPDQSSFPLERCQHCRLVICFSQCCCDNSLVYSLFLRLHLFNFPPTQEGQNDVDKGGWTIVSEDLTGAGTAAVEYKSGIGNFAKFLNGGKPFVDDLKLEITGDGVVEVRSASRVGDSDFKVNQKRLQYLAKAFKAKGWEVPEPTY